MTLIKKSLMVLTLAGAVAGCDSKDWAAAGYADGYATTVNTTCGFEATSVEGKYEKFNYARGYARGAQAAAVDVENRGCDSFK